ncbi:nuclear exosome regulator NRDE2 [Nerophis lumbriciformis]|uniref:nuclear exosome regulator NRDE2 n=1 Tax=Nerophis lumbriciformis TaxID=546530 RepID=UPI002ADF155B|nr:nuclear exosome regulator NRDE2-like [Nerophis lumbriciformis]
MALFPAFGQVSSDNVEDSSNEFNWLNNKSFQTSDALSLHRRFLDNKSDVPCSKNLSEIQEDEEHVPSRKKKKKHEKHGRKKKKHREKSKKSSDSSGSDCEPIFPSDLKQKQEADRPQAAPVSSCFSWLDDLQSPTAQPFCVDCKADPANWTYKSLYRAQVARYKRKGRSLLGLDCAKQEVRWEDSSKKKKKRGVERYFSTEYRQLLKSELPLPVLQRLPECSDVASASFFLPLGGTDEENKRETGGCAQISSVNPLGVYDSSTALWLQGKGRQAQTDHHDNNVKNEQEAVLLPGRTEEFNRQLREQPADTQLWLKFIRYQDELCATVFGLEEEQRGRDSSERRKSSYKAVLEKKLSIAERAVATNPSCIALQLERLRICQELWEPSVLAKEWKKLVFLHPNSGPLWREYLLFTQSYFSNFSVTKVNSAYGKCLSTLSAVRDGSMVSHPALPGIEDDMLDILTQQCHFLRQCGHSEKAFSIFQAMIEFTFYKPDSVQGLTTKQQAEFFEPFWDSGEARVGEWGAKGWKVWMVQQEKGGWLQPCEEEEEEDEDEEEEVKDRKQPRWTVWLNVESSREAAQWLPWRPDKDKGQSEEDCDDPERQVLFDDIGPSLICLSSSELQLRLLLNFLSFLGLPVESVLSASPCQPGLVLEDLSLLTQGTDPRHPLTSHNLPSLGVNSVGHMTTLQGTRKCAGLRKQGEKFVSNMFSMLQPALPVQHRAALSFSRMQYEKMKVLCCVHGNKKRLRFQSKSSKRIAKSLLKEPDNRSSLAMWREFAHLEWVLGNLEEARKVFFTATTLGGTKGLCNPTLCDLCLLWAQLEVEDVASGPGGVLSDGAPSPAVCLLTFLAEGKSSSPSSSPSVSPVAILKARKSYEQALTASLSALDQDLGNAQANKKGQAGVGEEKLRLKGLVGCYALFQYLTTGIQAASTVYAQARERMDRLHRTLTSDNLSHNDQFISQLIKKLAVECETLAVQQALLLKYHMSVGVFPLATLRDMLTSALFCWPSSAPLWSIYVQVENHYHSAGRARRFFYAVSRDSSSVVPQLFAIVAEQQRKQLVDAAQRSCDKSAALSVLPENGLSNRIRGLFESAILTEMGAHCPLLWRMYIYYLVSEGNMDKAKGLFYKALQNIPWVKGLYMDAVQLFPENLQEFIDLMTEKELRLRLPLEELDILLED